MALVDLTTNWNDTTQTGVVTYDNGENIAYSYSSTTAGGTWGTGSFAGHGGVESAVTVEQGEVASISFYEPATGVTVVSTTFSSTEDMEIRIDGTVIDLNEWLNDGKITITGTGVTESNQADMIKDDNGLFTGRGDGVGNGGGGHNTYINDVYYITFNVPVSNVAVTIYEDNVGGNDLIRTDFRLDTSMLPPCFTAGTLIDTDRGQVAVETLQTGDLIRTKDHGFQPVKWVGASRVYASGFDVPLRIKAGAFGNTRDLVVSKRHKMLMDHTHLSLMFDVEEAFACAMHLRNDDTITREPEGWVTYYHVLLPQHEVIFAEGAATESFYPDEGTLEAMAATTKGELLEHFDPKTYGPQGRPTLDPTRTMWIGRNLDVLKGDDMGQIAAHENAMRAAE